MSQADEPNVDEDLTPHFHWRWGEHGIYLAVCTAIGLIVLALYVWRMPAKRRFNPATVELIHVRYLASANEPPDKDEPFHDPRLLVLRRRM